MEKRRNSGILCHPTSLPGKYGIGTLGKEAFDFVDFLIESRQSLWQILPLGPTGYGNSPYQCFASNAGNPLLISLDKLVDQGLLTNEDLKTEKEFDNESVDYERIIKFKYKVLKNAHISFMQWASPLDKRKFKAFCEKNAFWLYDYALFMALKEHYNDRPWYSWEAELVKRDNDAIDRYTSLLIEPIEFQKFMQYLFFNQWNELKAYANQNYISIIGDIPIYVALDSVDVWANPNEFILDEKYNPVTVSGVPPDYFSEDGQLWGNPVFDWDKQEANNFKWWISRVEGALKLYDIIRIDHFRAFAEYWAVPNGEKTAKKGKWMPAKGNELFEALKQKFGEIPIIAEDLGEITPEVIKLRDKFGLPGMKILQFAFNSDDNNNFLPHNFDKNCVVYTGTHDNNSTTGWYENQQNNINKQKMLDYLNIWDHNLSPNHVCRELIRTAWSSAANTAIAPLQDLFELSSESRMNFPGTSSGNWKWRFTEDKLTTQLKERISKLTILYSRN